MNFHVDHSLYLYTSAVKGLMAGDVNAALD